MQKVDGGRTVRVCAALFGLDDAARCTISIGYQSTAQNGKNGLRLSERMAESLQIIPAELTSIEEKILGGERLNFEDGMALFRCGNVLALGHLANIVRERKNADRAYYIINQHINYTNVCVNRCAFCAFSRDPGDADAYTMSVEEVVARATAQHPRGGTEIHIVGGCHPDLTLDYYVEMLARLREALPRCHLQALTAVEVAHIARVSNLSVAETLRRLKKAGMGSIPGGGAEIFSPRIRALTCAKKIPAEEWLAVMRTAHRMGLRSNATMLYGHVEQPEETIDHLIRLRELQDKTGGFMSFIPLAFHPEGTQMSHLAGTTARLDLTVMAIARLMLDNFDHIKAFWIMLGVKLAQVALWFGADDLDGTVIEERITHSAGARTPQALTTREIRRLIREAGRTPVERDTLYYTIRRKGKREK
jgi:aminodeoxyfutalosine synthase